MLFRLLLASLTITSVSLAEASCTFYSESTSSAYLREGKVEKVEAFSYGDTYIYFSSLKVGPLPTSLTTLTCYKFRIFGMLSDADRKEIKNAAYMSMTLNLSIESDVFDGQNLSHVRLSK